MTRHTPGLGAPMPLRRPPYQHRSGLSVITIGSGNPMPSLARASACTMIQHHRAYYVLDVGNGAVNSFLKAQPDSAGTTAYAFQDVAAVLFTHLHQDHVSDFFDLVTNRWMSGGGELRVIGPPGTAQLHEFLTRFFKDDLAYRMLRRIAGGTPLEQAMVGMFEGVESTEITGGATFDLGPMKVRTAEMCHTQYDIAYRFDVDGRSIVVSGDTSYTPALVELAEDVDLLVMDTDVRVGGESPVGLDPDVLPPWLLPQGQHGGRFDVEPHASLKESIEMATTARVKHLVLTHFREGPVDEVAVRAAYREGGFDGALTFATDGLEVAV
ncbi:MAG: MBL fold metallo-hydrolase [Thermoleophilia bacterium]